MVMHEASSNKGETYDIASSHRRSAAAGFPAMQGNVAFLMKDVVFLAVSVYLLKQDVVRAAALPAAERRQGQETAGAHAWAGAECAAR